METSKKILDELKDTGTTQLRELLKCSSRIIAQIDGLECQKESIVKGNVEKINMCDKSGKHITTLRGTQRDDFVDGFLIYLNDKIAEAEMELEYLRQKINKLR